MNGFAPNYQHRPLGDEQRQAQTPQSLPPLSHLNNYPGQSGSSPGSSHLPPISGQNGPPPYNPSHLSRSVTQSQGTTSHGQSQSSPFSASDHKPNSLGPAHSAPFPPTYLPPYSAAQSQQHPFVNPAGSGGQNSSAYYSTGGQQPPLAQSFVDVGHPASGGLLPPFNPQGQSAMPANCSSLGPANDRPIPVVGSQGRRGILPSAPGRASAIAPDNGAAKNMMATTARRSDGKFECAFCNKSYLHLKHLKRHHLRRKSEHSFSVVDSTC